MTTLYEDWVKYAATLKESGATVMELNENEHRSLFQNVRPDQMDINNIGQLTFGGLIIKYDYKGEE